MEFMISSDWGTQIWESSSIYFLPPFELLATCFHAGILFGLLFNPEGGGNMFL
jgi:hypothetical protein